MENFITLVKQGNFMCQAIPKKVISIKDNVAVIESSEGNFKVSVLENNVKAGDYLLVYGNVALCKVERSRINLADK